MKRYLLFMLTCLFALVSSAQDVNLKGTVIAKTDRQPVIGAYV